MPTPSANPVTYPADTAWEFQALGTDYVRTTPLRLGWELRGSPISDDYVPDEITGRELWHKYLAKYANLAFKDNPLAYGPGDVVIYWTVHGQATSESAPFQTGTPDNLGDFLTHYSWPVNATTVERCNFLRLPVADLRWTRGQGDKGGFVREATGWKPSPLQPVVNVYALSKAAGLGGFAELA
ncbi:MAG: hypothetical protein JWL97_4380 [Gemmatimonadales bacterium]|nr:hypothetical protein [Gemmatimonadales bacterium]